MRIYRYFTAREVISFTGITYRRLDCWVNAGVVRASGRSKVKRGQPRLFTFRDIVEIRVVLKLIHHGLRLSLLKDCLKSVRKRIPEVESPLASEKLVTDGKKVFRYVPEIGALESFDEFGQFAFAFELGEEIKAVVEEIEKNPFPVRYVKSIRKNTSL